MFDPGDHDFGDDDLGPVVSTGLASSVVWTLIALMVVIAMAAAAWGALLALAWVLGL